MKTSKQWWDETKHDKSKLTLWLQRQQYGERIAAGRIAALATKAPNSRVKALIERIANDESRHTEWITNLLQVRGIPILEHHIDRYWLAVGLNDHFTFEELCAIGHHAEHMRLERIRVIANDQTCDEDIRQVFEKILVDEEFHDRAFEALTTKDLIIKYSENHQLGLEVLGLTM